MKSNHTESFYDGGLSSMALSFKAFKSSQKNFEEYDYDKEK
ncbi:MAG: hypothetical protein ABR927_03395 [Bacteroidales bacterium]